MILGRVEGIFIAPDSEAPMRAIEQAYALRGKGLEGDRYALGLGKHPKKCEITLITAEAIGAANGFALPDARFGPEHTRRNIVTRGIRPDELLELIDELFCVGPVMMQGIRECTPCTKPSRLSGIEGFETRFAKLGGLRAKILNAGAFGIGSIIHTW